MLKRYGLTVILGVVSLAQAPLNVASAAQQTAEAKLAAFIDDFVDRSEAEELSVLSAESFADELAQTQRDLARLRSIDTSALSLDEQIDWKFAQSILRGREIEQESIQSWRKDPRVYMRFRSVAGALAAPGSRDEKVANLLDVLRVIPEQLGNGQKNLGTFLPRFQELSVFMAEGGLAMFEKDVPEFARTIGHREDEIIAAAEAAGEALRSYIEFLETELPQKPRGDWAIGKATYDEMLRDQYLLPYDADELYDFGVREFERTVEEMQQVAKRIDPTKSWQELAVEIKNDYPDPDRMIEVHQEWVDKSREHILSNNLVPIPWKERVDVVPRAEYLRKYSYYGNFSGAKARNEEGVFVAQWMINPFEEQWDDNTKQEYLVEHDYGVIIVTAPHESYAGHHVQQLYQLHNPRELRRANGLALFSEGWGLYNEQLMRETGFYPDERIHLRHLQLRLWRNARVVWDVGIHTGKMSYEEAVSLLSERVGFLRWAAQLEVDGSAQSPGYRIGYFVGMSEILEMRADYKEAMGDEFSLSEFHERLLKIGNMPPALMREALMATVGD